MAFIVGLTGGIGSGKSYIARLWSKLGIPVYDSDSHAKLLMHSDEALRNKIIKEFGQESYHSDHSLNRTFLASQVFSNPDRLQQLNSLVHPAVKLDFEKWAEMQKSKYVIKETAILFEADLCKSCDICVLVTAPESLRLERIKLRDGSDEVEIKKRMLNQWPDDKKKNLAHMLIENDGRKSIISQLLAVHHSILKKAEQNK